MSKTLVERLRLWAKADGAGIWDEAADRITELEASDRDAEVVYNKRLEMYDQLQRKHSELVDGINNLSRFVMKLSQPSMDKPQRVEWYPHKDGGWIANHQLRALLEKDDDFQQRDQLQRKHSELVDGLRMMDRYTHEGVADLTEIHGRDHLWIIDAELQALLEQEARPDTK